MSCFHSYSSGRMPLGWALNAWVLSPKPTSLRGEQLCSVPSPTLVYFSVSGTLEPGDHGLHPQKLGAEINPSCLKSSFSVFVTTKEKVIHFISDFSFRLQTSVPVLGPSREAVYIPQFPKMPYCKDSSSFSTHPEPSFSQAEACPLPSLGPATCKGWRLAPDPARNP